VEVDTRDGQHLTARVDVPKGDPGNPLTRSEIEDKARLLASWRDAASPQEIDRIIARVWRLADEGDVRGWVMDDE
jgi:2-methylcitrate dehydratase PrpD